MVVTHTIIATSIAIALLLCVAVRTFLRFREINKNEYLTGVAKLIRDAGGNDEQLARIVENNPSCPEPLVGYIKSSIANGDWGATLYRAEVLQNKFPKLPDGWRYRAFALRQTNQLDLAEEILGIAKRKFPKNADVAIDYTSIIHLQQNFVVAKNQWEQIIKKYPKLPKAYCGLADTLLQQGALNEASLLMNKAFNLFPGDANIAIKRAEISTWAQDWLQSELRWTQIIERYPGRPEGYTRLCEALRHLGKVAQARPIAEAAAAAFPMNRAARLEYEKIVEQI